jgi:uncharacterized glyoxalase superfamily protein PhnB
MASRKTAQKKVARKKTSGKARTSARARPRGLVLGGASPSFTVADVEKSLAWYRDVLGCAVGDRWESDGKLLGVEMNAGSVVFMLSQDDWKKGRDRAKGEGFRLYVETGQDIDALGERIRKNGGTLAEEPKDQPWGSRTLAVVDPDGFKLTIARPVRRAR